MKTLNVTFTEREYKKLLKFKEKAKNMSWHEFIIRGGYALIKLRNQEERQWLMGRKRTS